MRDDILDDGIHLPKEDSLANAKEILRLKGDYEELHKKVRHGRNAIYWLIGLQALGFLIEGAQTNFDLIVVGVYVFVISSFIVAAVLAQKQPVIGFSIALGLLILMQALLFFADPLTALSGILVRGIIAYFLIVGISAARNYISTLRGLKSHGINVEGSELV